MLPGGQYTICPTCRLKGQFLSFCHFQKKKVLFWSMDQPYKRKDDSCQGTLVEGIKHKIELYVQIHCICIHMYQRLNR